MKLRRLAGAVVLGVAALVLTHDTPSAAPGQNARAGDFRIVLSSSRSGEPRAYSAGPDGTKLTPLLGPRRPLAPFDVSHNGRVVAYWGGRYPPAVYASRADGTGVHRVTREKAYIESPVLSPDGTRLAYTVGRWIFVVGIDGRGRQRFAAGSQPAWAPNGHALAFVTGGKRCAIAVQPLRGTRRVLARGACDSIKAPKWSPDGRWVAYETNAPAYSVRLWVVGSTGRRRHRVANSNVSYSSYSWSPDSRKLAYVGDSDLYVADVSGGSRALHLGLSPLLVPPVWSPNGRQLLLSAHEAGDPDQVWEVGRDGHGLHRLTNAGLNVPLGWTRLVPVLSPAPPVPPTERVLGPSTVATRKPITELSADGAQAAFVPGGTRTDCEHVDVWTPARRSIQRVSQHLPAPCGYRGPSGLVEYTIYELALAGPRVAWSEVLGCGNFCDVALASASLANGRPLHLYDDSGGGGAGGGEYERFNPHGHGDLLVFNPGDSIVRINDECARKCGVLRAGAHTYPVDSASEHLIAVREPAAVAVVDDHGSVVNVLPFARNEVKAARIDGSSLVVARSGLLEVYDAVTGAAQQQRPLPAGYALAEVDGGVAVLRKARSILLLRLADGRSVELTPARGPVLADLEAPGLYYSYVDSSGQGRLVFLPRSELTARFASSAQRAFHGSAGGAAAGADWLLLNSNRDGKERPYSMNVDGTRLTALFPLGKHLEPVALSRDGSMVAYTTSTDGPPAAIYISRADGSGLRQVARKGFEPRFSPNGRLLAFTTRKGIWVVGTDGRGLRRLTSREDDTFDWSPNGKAIVFMRVINAANDRFAVVVKPLRGRERVLVRTGPNEEADTAEYEPQWSPNGRWIAYVNHEDKARRNGLTVVRPNGTHRHRAALGAGEDDTFQWSPDGSWMAYISLPELFSIRPSGAWFKVASHVSAYSVEWSPDRRHLAFPVFAESGEDLAVARGDGRGVKRLHLGVTVESSPPVWSPDSTHIAFAGNAPHDPRQLWVAGSDGQGLRRLTNEGENYPVGWTRLAPALPPVSSLPQTERVVAADMVVTATKVGALSADGSRVAFAPLPTATDCMHVVVWTQGDEVLRRLGNLPAPCRGIDADPPIPRLALADSRAAWVADGGPYDTDGCSFLFMSATLADPAAREFGGTGFEPTFGPVCSSGDYGHLRGDGELLVFNDEPKHSLWLVRLGTAGAKCGEVSCTPLRKSAEGTPVASVSSGLIAVRKNGSVAVFDAAGTLVRLLSFTPADVNGAVLDGGHLVVWRFGVLEVYDVATGGRELSQPLPPGFRLTDVDGGIAVLRKANTIMLLRLSDGRSLSLAPGAAPVLAELEGPGLYYSFTAADGSGRVVFVPRATLVQQLGGAQ
jgi:TolB protein